MGIQEVILTLSAVKTEHIHQKWSVRSEGELDLKEYQHVMLVVFPLQ